MLKNANLPTDMMAWQTKIRCITFDLDDTLWACGPVIQRAEQRFYAWLDQHYPEVTAKFTAQALFTDRVAFVRAHPEHGFNLTYLRKSWLHRLAQLCGLSDHFVEPAFRVYWLARNEVDIYTGVQETLQTLSQRYRLGAITNGNADVYHIGIGHWFDFVIRSEEVGFAKPDKRIFTEAATQAGVALNELLHVGDDHRSDVCGAINAGAWSAWVGLPGTIEPEALQPHWVVQHIQELPLLLGIAD